MDQTEHFYYVTARGLLTSKRPRKHMKKSTTAGTSIGPLPLPDWKDTSDTWHLSFKDKKVLWGQARILPSGRPDGDQDLVGSGEKRVTQARKDGDVEPVCYHSLHRVVFEELVHQVGPWEKIRCIVDLTPTDSTLGLLAMEMKVPYLAIVNNEFHRDALQRRLTFQVFQKQLSPKSPLYIPKLGALMNLTGTKPEEPKPQPEAEDEEEEEENDDLPDTKPPKKKGRKTKGEGSRATLLGALLDGGGCADDGEAAVGED